MNFPQARTDNLLKTELDEEVVVYDPERKQAHSLNRTAVAVWNHCDGQTPMGELQRRVSAEVGVPISEAAILLALRKLERAHLLAHRLDAVGPMTRRQLLERAGYMGAAVAAGPIVFSALVPTSAAAVTLGKCVAVGGVTFCDPPTNSCTCLVTVDAGTKCLQNTAVAAAACSPGILPCANGQSCVGGFCQCTASAVQCPGGACVSDTTKLCHLNCVAATCTC